MTTYNAPALPGDFKTPPDGPIVYAFEPLWGAGTPVYFPRYSYEWEQKQGERTSIVAPPGLPGGWDVDGDGWHFWEPMTVSVRFKVPSAGERRSILAGCVGPGRLWAIDEDGSAYWTRARLVAPRNQMDIYDMAHRMYPLALEFICPFGAWFAPSNDASSLYGYANYGESSYGSTQGFPLISDSDSGEIMNPGNLPLVALIMTIFAGAGGVDTPTIRNEETGQELTIDGVLPDARSWVLDTSVPSLLKEAVDDWDNLTVGSPQQGLLYLLPGSNTITVTSGTTMDGIVTFEYFAPYRI